MGLTLFFLLKRLLVSKVCVILLAVIYTIWTNYFINLISGENAKSVYVVTIVEQETTDICCVSDQQK